MRHRLTKRAMAHTLEVLERYQRIAAEPRLRRDPGVRHLARCAKRPTAGISSLAAKRQLGLRIQVISAQEEAHLIYLAVRQAIDLSSHGGAGPSLIVDIGGGSCELIVGTNARPLLLESFKLGASRLTQQFVHSDPIGRRDLERLEKHIRKTLKPTLAAIGGAARAAGDRHLGDDGEPCGDVRPAAWARRWSGSGCSRG